MRRENLRMFRRGMLDTIVCCRALDEGVNVPEASVAIVADTRLLAVGNESNGLAEYCGPLVENREQWYTPFMLHKLRRTASCEKQAV